MRIALSSICLYSSLLLFGYCFGEAERTESSFNGFSGQVIARVEAQLESGTKIKVLKVNTVWKSNRAKQPEQLAEKSILIREQQTSSRNELQRAYLKGLRVGQNLQIEIKKGENDFWEVLELNAEQRRIAQGQLASQRRLHNEPKPETRALSHGRKTGMPAGNITEDKEIFIQMNRLKHENAELRNRVQKLETRLFKIENQIKERK